MGAGVPGRAVPVVGRKRRNAHAPTRVINVRVRMIGSHTIPNQHPVAKARDRQGRYSTPFEDGGEARCGSAVPMSAS